LKAPIHRWPSKLTGTACFLVVVGIRGAPSVVMFSPFLDLFLVVGPGNILSQLLLTKNKERLEVKLSDPCGFDWF